MTTLCHLSSLVQTQAEKFGNKTALVYRHPQSGEWTPISWIQFSQTVNQTAKALLAIGTKPQENIAVFSQNMPQCFYVDFAGYAIRAVTIPLYATSSLEQVGYIISDAQINTIFVGEQRQYDTIFPLISLNSNIKRIIIFSHDVIINPADNISIYFDEFLAMGESSREQDELTKRISEADFSDTCNILYTSGTTGNSKGVIITYAMYNNAILENSKALPITQKDIFLNFLPFAHVFERGCSYLGLSVGAVQVINKDPGDVLKAMREIRPTCMCAVPRFWEKVYETVNEKMKNSSAIKRTVFKKALAVGKRVINDYESKGKKTPAALKLQYKLYDSLVFSIIRRTIGLTRGNFFPTAGASISKDIETFVHMCGICMIVGYGLTESTATVSCDRKGEPFTPGSVGRILNGVEVRISGDGEILLKGKRIMPQYYKKPKSTAEVIDNDGWFHTGDAGFIKDGELFLTDRIKDLYKTSNGKYISPQQIESKLVVDKYIDQITIIADNYKYVSALIVPNYTMLEIYAKEKGIAYTNHHDLCKNPTINAMIEERIDTLQQGLAKYEQVKRFTLLPQPFSIKHNEITNTLKVKRRIVFERYANEINAMYT